MKSKLLEALADRVLIFDGAMGTQIQAADLTAEDFTLRESAALPPQALAAAKRLDGRFLEGCNELLNLTRPDAIQAIHANYLAAGADVIETNTFGCTSIVLAEYEIPELVYEIAYAAGEIARRAANAASTPERPRFVAGAIGPGTKLVSLGQTTFEELESTYSAAFEALLSTGADALMIETVQDLLMAKATVAGAISAMERAGRKVPLFVSLTMEQTGTMLLGTELGAAVNTLEAFPEVTAIGLNCATGPVEMSPHVRFLSQSSTRPISVLPNAGLPVMEGGRAVYKLSPVELAEHHEHFVRDLGAAMVGGCCGTTPEHVREIADRLAKAPHGENAHWRKVRGLFPGFDFRLRYDVAAIGSSRTDGARGSDPPHAKSLGEAQASAFRLVGCSSLYQFQPYKQDASFLIVGEKTNANGSKAFRDMLAAENWEGLTELARELEGEGSHVLDVCTAYVGRDEARDMKELLSRYNRHVTVPIMVDSTEAPVVETALRCLAGKPIVNSINFEDGEARTHKVLGLCRRYGAAVVGLTIDEDGMAKSAEKKVAIAERLIRATRSHGVPDHDLFLDCLTFTLGSGDEEFRPAGIETIEAIREIRRRFPAVNSILGVSNISFGLKPSARVVLNSAFLHYALEAGLTAAIVHFSKILPENRIESDIWKVASDLVFDRREFAQAG
jgi:5-methyltetrahydrofolate--homocysteine methyltransferase